MVVTNYGLIPDKLFDNYLKFLVSKFFKILPIYETEKDTLEEYLSSLLIELSGNKSLIVELKNDPNFLSLLGTIQYLISEEYSHAVCKKEVFKCIKIVEKLQEKYIQ